MATPLEEDDDVLYYEDVAVGDRFELSGWTVTRAEIMDFAKMWAPQPFHIDQTAAEESMFGDLVASGLHTMCVAMRLANRDVYRKVAALGGFGMSDVEIPRPVYVDETLSGHVEFTEKWDMDSDPDRGIVRVKYVLSNQQGDRVLAMHTDVIFAREPSAD